jgi:surface carbohydrate biosynthesis protein
MTSNKIVIIHIDTFRREYLSAWLLGECLKKKGYKVFLTSRHSTTRFLKLFTPDIFICTHVFQLRASEIKDLVDRGVKIYINEVEGTDHVLGVSTTYPEQYAGETIDYSLFSGIFVWGKFSHDWVLQHRQINPQQVVMNGSTRQSALSRPKPKTGDVVVGIISRFEVINTFDKRHVFYNLMSLDPEDPDWIWYYERCAIDAQTFSIVYKIMGNLVEKGYKISMRPHPNENLEGYQLLKDKFGCFFEIDQSKSINEWLSKVSAVVGTTSTAFTEPYLAKIPIISTSKIQDFHYSDKDQAHLIGKFDLAAHTPESIAEAIELCTNSELEPKSSSELDDYFDLFYSLSNKIDPIERIVTIVDAENNDKIKRTPVRSFIAGSILLLLDLVYILKGILKMRNFRSFGTLKIYNYNRFFHKPSSFMKNASLNIKQSN